MSLSRAKPSTFDTCVRVHWLDASPPLQPWPGDGLFEAASKGVEANPDFGLVEERNPRHVARRSSLLIQRTGSEVDQVDCVLRRERWETMYAALSSGLGECPSWLVLAIERKPI